MVQKDLNSICWLLVVRIRLWRHFIIAAIQHIVTTIITNATLLITDAIILDAGNGRKEHRQSINHNDTINK